MNVERIWYLSATTLVLAVGLFVCGCSRLPRVVLFNNSGVEVVVFVGEKRIAVTNGSKATLFYPTNKRFAVERHGVRDSYEAGRLPDKRFAYPPGGAPVYYAQMETNGWVYLCPPRCDFPVTRLMEQPDGFPLRPVSNSVERAGR